MDGSFYEDDDLKSKMDGYKTSHKVDGSSYEDDDLKSKMAGYKKSPQSGRIILRGRFEVQNGQIQNKSTKWTDLPTTMTI